MKPKYFLYLLIPFFIFLIVSYFFEKDITSVFSSVFIVSLTYFLTTVIYFIGLGFEKFQEEDLSKVIKTLYFIVLALLLFFYFADQYYSEAYILIIPSFLSFLAIIVLWVLSLVAIFTTRKKGN